MKLGLGLYRRSLTQENFRFARQAGCTHLVVHLVDRFRGAPLPQADAFCFGQTRAQGRVWTEDELQAIQRMAHEEGLEIEALENIDPSFWCDILLDGPRKHEQIQRLKGLLRSMGRLGIPILGYNFSLAGVWGRRDGAFARGGALAPAFIAEHLPEMTPVPQGQLNNIVYDPDAPLEPIPAVSREGLWERLAWFLRELVPVARGGVGCGHPTIAVPSPTDAAASHQSKVLSCSTGARRPTPWILRGSTRKSETNLYERSDQYSRQGASAYTLSQCTREVPHYPRSYRRRRCRHARVLASCSPRLRGNHPTHTR